MKVDLVSGSSWLDNERASVFSLVVLRVFYHYWWSMESPTNFCTQLSGNMNILNIFCFQVYWKHLLSLQLSASFKQHFLHELFGKNLSPHAPTVHRPWWIGNNVNIICLILMLDIFDLHKGKCFKIRLERVAFFVVALINRQDQLSSEKE